MNTPNHLYHLIVAAAGAVTFYVIIAVLMHLMEVTQAVGG